MENNSLTSDVRARSVIGLVTGANDEELVLCCVWCCFGPRNFVAQSITRVILS